jgi:hypothetical protein
VRCIPDSAFVRSYGRDRGTEHRHDIRWALDFDDESLIVFVIELDDDGALGIVNVVEDEPAALVEGAGCEKSGNLRAGEA